MTTEGDFQTRPNFVVFWGRHNSAKHWCVTKNIPISAKSLKSLYPRMARYQTAPRSDRSQTTPVFIIKFGS